MRERRFSEYCHRGIVNDIFINHATTAESSRVVNTIIVIFLGFINRYIQTIAILINIIGIGVCQDNLFVTI